MTTPKYLDTSHMSKLESKTVVIQDYLKTCENDAITWAFRLKEDGQASSLHDQTIQHLWEMLKDKRSLHLKPTNMKEHEHINILQYTQGSFTTHV